MIKIKKPKFKAQVFDSSKELRSVNMLYFGILIDTLYLNGSQKANVQIYVSPENTDILIFLKLKNRKMENYFENNLLDISGISDKPLRLDHQLIIKKAPDFYFLAVQSKYLQTEQKITFDEILYQFQYESTKKVFWQGLQTILKRQKKPKTQHATHIMQALENETSLQEASAFIRKRNPFILEFYLDRIIKKYDVNFLNVLQKTDIVYILKEINVNQELSLIFQKACKEFFDDPFEVSMTFVEFTNFQKDILKDPIFDDIFLLQTMRKINPDHDIRIEKLSFYDFCYILQDNNSCIMNNPIQKEEETLDHYFIFNNVFVCANLVDTIKSSLERGSIFYDFVLIDSKDSFPHFKIRNQTSQPLPILALFSEHLLTSDLPLIVNFNIQCSKDQLSLLLSIIQDKLSKHMYSQNNLSLSQLKQKIMFVGGGKGLEWSSFKIWNVQQLKEGLERNQKGLVEACKNSINAIRISSYDDITAIQLFGLGFQLIIFDGQIQTNDRLVYLSRFQTKTQKYSSFAEKPLFLFMPPQKYVHLDFYKIKTTFSLNIISGYQMNSDNIYLQISVKGIASDENNNPIYQSKVFQDGFMPFFNQFVQFDVRCQEFAQILIEVFHKSFFTEDKLISWVALNYNQVKPGVRKINLRNLDYEWFQESYLMISLA